MRVSSDIRVSSDMRALPDACVASDTRVASDIRVSSGRLSALADADMASSALSVMGADAESNAESDAESGEEARVSAGRREIRGFEVCVVKEKKDKAVSCSMIGWWC